MSELPEPEAVVEILRVQPGDTIVLRYPAPLSNDNAQSIKERAQNKWPDNNVVIVDSGAELSAIEPTVPGIVECLSLPVPDDGPEGNYGLRVELQLLSDGTVRWEYEPR